MEEVIQVTGLVKRFGSLIAVDDISFPVYRNEIFGIIGPNGAGKTTTLEIIEGLQRPTSGTAVVLGISTDQDSGAVKERIGVQLQASTYFDYLTLHEILALFGSFYRKCVSPEELLGKVGLREKGKTTLKKLSGGQRQRFTIAASLVNDPDVVILDEPTTGLDPQARRNLWSIIQQINSDGKTIVLTTHYMEEAQALCHRVAIMDMGRIVGLDTPTRLIQALDLPYVVTLMISRCLRTGETEDLQLSQDDVLVTNGRSLQLRVHNAPLAVARILDWTSRRELTVEHLEVIPSSLEDVFFTLTGKEMRD